MPEQVQQTSFVAELGKRGIVEPDKRVGGLWHEGLQKLSILFEDLPPQVEQILEQVGITLPGHRLAMKVPLRSHFCVVEQVYQPRVGLRFLPKHLQLVDLFSGDLLALDQVIDDARDELPIWHGYVLQAAGCGNLIKLTTISNMKQASSVSKVSEQAIKNRKLNLSRNNIGSLKDQPKTVNRLKSNHEVDPIENTASQLPIKPKSSMGRRPLSSQKHTETVNSIATTSSAKSEEEVKEIIMNIFSHSKKLHDFLGDKGIDHEQALERLTGNELFTLSLVQMVSNKNPEEVGKSVERCCIHKLGRMLAMEKQITICDQLETKIEELINKRIKALSHF